MYIFYRKIYIIVIDIIRIEKGRHIMKIQNSLLLGYIYCLMALITMKENKKRVV